MEKPNPVKESESSATGCDTEKEIAAGKLGQAASTSEDLAAEGSGKKLLEATSEEQSSTDDATNSTSQRIKVTLDPICGMSVDEKNALNVERDGKIFYFCSEQCRTSFLETIAGVKSESKSGSCCG